MLSDKFDSKFQEKNSLVCFSNFRITLSLDFYGMALVYTSATLAAATTNCLPVTTFFLAVLLR
jgi:hypothetical protein